MSVISRFKSISVQLNLPTGTELGKNKNMFWLFNKAGPLYKAVLFMLMKRLIEKEKVHISNANMKEKGECTIAQ